MKQFKSLTIIIFATLALIWPIIFLFKHQDLGFFKPGVSILVGGFMISYWMSLRQNNKRNVVIIVLKGFGFSLGALFIMLFITVSHSG